MFLSPSVLSHDYHFYSIPFIESPTDVRLVGILLLYGVFLGILMYAVITPDRRVMLELALVVLPFLPISNIFFPVGFNFAERCFFLPSLGCTCIITHFFEWCWMSPVRCRGMFTQVRPGLSPPLPPPRCFKKQRLLLSLCLSPSLSLCLSMFSLN